MSDLLILSEAEEEYSRSLDWYAERSRRAADAFEAEFTRVLEAITKDPERYPLFDNRHRSYLMKRYPFQVIYRNTSTDRILIVAVAHTSRRPGYWSGR